VEYAFEYQYDKAHNRRVKVDNGTPTYYTYNEANELTEETTDGQTTYYHYDRCGNTVAKQEASGTTYYVYDTENLMTRIDFADGSHNYFAFDADSKRVSKEDSEGFTEFIYQGPDMLRLLLERDDQGETHLHYTMGVPLRQGYGGQVGLESVRQDAESSFYHFDALGSTYRLTDAVEEVTDTYRYNAWGEILATTGDTFNRHTFVGRERYCMTPNSSYALLGLRYYVPRVGRFVTVDPLRHWFGLPSSKHCPWWRREADPAASRRTVITRATAIRDWPAARGRAITTQPICIVPYAYCKNRPTLVHDPSGAIDWGLVGKCLKEAGCMLAASGLVCIGAGLVVDEACVTGCALSITGGPEALAACTGGCTGVGEVVGNTCLIAVALPATAMDIIACATEGTTHCLDSCEQIVCELREAWERFWQNLIPLPKG